MDKVAESELQMKLRQRLETIKAQKGLKNNEIAAICGRSESVISEMLNAKRNFDDKLIYSMLNKLSDYMQDGELVTTVRQYTKMYNIAIAGKKASDMRLVVGNTGIGKSVVYKRFASENTDTYYLKVDRRYTWNKLLLEINRVMGIEVGKTWTNALLDNIIRKVEQTTGNNPLLIIDESEVLPNPVYKQLKNLYTSTEGLMGIMLVGITEVKARIARLAGLSADNWRPVKDDSNVYTTFARRLRVFRIDNIDQADIESFCRSKGIENRDVIKLACSKWWNYAEADRAISRAEGFGMKLNTLSVDEFNLL
ncbi:MAG: ATP-binding protein [Bacteroidales bacterium]|nr:ATP-binding protein [Bacteroidales bacterium]MDD3666712.1 ATP-binding protein [Bacteroidales bacterium]